MQYKAHRNQMGHLVVQNVPIFVTCKRGDSSFDKGWLEQAVMAARQAELEGYLPPLHIRHHDDGPQPEPAGVELGRLGLSRRTAWQGQGGALRLHDTAHGSAEPQGISGGREQPRTFYRSRLGGPVATA